MTNLPDAEAWDRWAHIGDRATRKAMTTAIKRVAGQHPHAALAVILGAITATGELIAAISRDGNARVAEEITLAYIRGAIRGETKPLNADGSDYTGASFDG